MSKNPELALCDLLVCKLASGGPPISLSVPGLRLLLLSHAKGSPLAGLGLKENKAREVVTQRIRPGLSSV